MTNKDLKRRIIDISFRNKLSHLSSCLTAVDIIEDIYQKKQPKEKFILSAGHAGLALYVVLEKHLGHDAEKLFNLHGVHPNRDPHHGIWLSTGSLGHGLPIAVGMAIADRNKDVYCLITDGEAHEGSIYEAINFMGDVNVDNLKVFCNWNGFTAYKTPSSYVKDYLENNADINMVYTDTKDYPFLKGIDGHYHVMSESDYLEAMEILS